LAVGNHTITTNYAGDGNFNGSTGSLTGNPQVVNKTNTTTAVTSSQNPSVFGQAVTFTATVSAVAPGSGTPTGTVTFLDGGSPIGTGTLSGGIATFTTSALAVGNHTITTSYAGDSNFNGSTGSLTGNPQVVNKADTATTVTSSQNPSVFGQSVTFTATVSAVAPGSGTPTGTVTFLDGGSPIGTGTLSGGIATFTTSALAVGNHTITTNYAGDGNFNGSTGSLTGNPQVVNKANTATTVTSSVNPSVFGQSVTFTATVSAVAPGSGTPTGTVTFLDGGSPIGTGTLSGGIATFTTSALAVGNHTITTSYAGDGNFNGSTGSLTGNPQVVNKADTATTVTSSQNPSALNQSVTFTATVSAVAPGSGTPTGTVTFLDGGSPIGTGTLSGGVATLTTSSLTAGAHTITTTYAGDGNFNGSIGSLTGNPQVVLSPPSIAKAFNPSTIALNATTSLTFTIINPSPNPVTLTGVAFSDTLPAGLSVANSTSTVCGGTLTTTAPTGISLSGATIAANAQCQFSVTVTGTASGQYVNTTGNVTSTNGGTGNTASASLSVASAPSINKQFGAASIPLNGTTSLTFTIQNPNTNVTLNGIGFTDNLPAGLVVAATPNLSNTCGGTATAVGGSGSVTLAAGTLASSASCTVSVNVQGTTAGVKNNSVQVSSTEGGAGNTSNASITVTGPPVLLKAFGAASIPLNGTTSLSFTIQNNNTTLGLTGVAFTDALPAGLVVSTPNGLTGSCGAGTITATQGSNGISLSGGTIAASSSCTFSVNVTGTAAGAQNNTTSSVSSTEGGTGAAASASVNVEAPPSIAKVFNPSTIALNATTSLTFTITNPAANVQPLTGVAFTDTLPTGLTVANASSTVCGGTLTTAAPGSISLSGATIAANAQCQFSVTVTGAAAGQYTNTTGSVTSTNGGTGNTASANLTVGTPPTITKAFGAASILLNASTSLTFNISNPNTNLALTGVAFTDTLPAGLQVATPSGLTSSCGGTATAAAGSGSISLTGGSLAASASCTISLNVTGVAAGVENNTTGPISSNESGAGATSNTASITVIGPPSISKAFGAASINLNATTTLTFTITNPNATVALSGVGFGDTLPAGLAVANPNGLTGSCGSGTITTGSVSGFSVVNLANGTIAAGGSCTFSVNVVGTSGGHKTNTTGIVTSSNAGSGNQATATIDVLAPDPTITKTHSGAFTRGQQGAQWTITISNVGFGPTVGTVTMVDTLPNVQNPPVATALSGSGWSCTLATLTCTRADALASGSSYPAITLTVNIPQNIQNNFTNTATVSGGGDVNPNNNTATDKISLGPPLVITPHASSSASVQAGTAGQFVFDVEDDDPSLGMVSFGCNGLPIGTTCTFNPPATNQAISQVTMTITTSNHSSNVVTGENLGSKPPRFVAALFLPVLGFVGICLGGRSKKQWRMRLALAFVGMVTLLAFAGCSGLQGITTPAGSYQITVSAATTTVQATTQVTLSVK
jgi:uncharacterized repeat protein (TIGR01451 family)/fimbrial isopeptide formation D2 family protein